MIPVSPFTGLALALTLLRGRKVLWAAWIGATDQRHRLALERTVGQALGDLIEHGAIVGRDLVTSGPVARGHTALLRQVHNWRVAKKLFHARWRP